MNGDLDFERVLDQALDALAAGEPREAVLTRFASHRPALEPLLEAAEAASAGLNVPIPAPHLDRGRGRFLAAARKPASPLAGWLGVLRPALAILAIVVLAAVGAGAASANALPGDLLYPIKLAVEEVRLAVTWSAEARGEYAEQLRARRRIEAQQAADLGRETAVRLEGTVEVVEAERLTVSGAVVYTTEAEFFAPGDYVVVTAHTRAGVIVADEIKIVRPGRASPEPTSPRPRPTPTEAPARASQVPSTPRPLPSASPTRSRPTETRPPTATPSAVRDEATHTVTQTPSRPSETTGAPGSTQDRPGEASPATETDTRPTPSGTRRP